MECYQNHSRQDDPIIACVPGSADFLTNYFGCIIKLQHFRQVMLHRSQTAECLLLLTTHPQSQTTIISSCPLPLHRQRALSLSLARPCPQRRRRASVPSPSPFLLTSLHRPPHRSVDDDHFMSAVTRAAVSSPLLDSRTAITTRQRPLTQRPPSDPSPCHRVALINQAAVYRACVPV